MAGPFDDGECLLPYEAQKPATPVFGERRLAFETAECTGYRALREERLRAGLPVETSEVALEAWLRNIAPEERHGIDRLFADHLYHFWRAWPSFMALAVGTTTYDCRYWEGLRAFLAERDPGKLPFVDRRGEDLDILLVPEMYASAGPAYVEGCIASLRRNLDAAGVEYAVELNRTSRTAYLCNPSGGVEREKQFDPDVPALVLSLPSSRPVHLTIDDTLTGENKLFQERLRGWPFAVLFRDNGYRSFSAAVEAVGLQGELFSR